MASSSDLKMADSSAPRGVSSIEQLRMTGDKVLTESAETGEPERKQICSPLRPNEPTPSTSPQSFYPAKYDVDIEPDADQEMDADMGGDPLPPPGLHLGGTHCPPWWSPPPFLPGPFARRRGEAAHLHRRKGTYASSRLKRTPRGRGGALHCTALTDQLASRPPYRPSMKRQRRLLISLKASNR